MTRPSNQRRRRPARPRPPADLWQPAVDLPDVEPIVVPAEVGTMLRSLGDPPSIGGRSDAGHYFIAVAERAAALAAALALTADLLAEQPAD